MTDILMPRLSDSMERGTVLAWLIPAGEEVSVGDELLEIETDKATVTHVAEVEGRLEILASEGATLSVGEPIARITEQARTGAGRGVEHRSSELPPAPTTLAAEAASPAPSAAPAPEPPPTGQAGASPVGRAAPLKLQGGRGSTGSAIATPLARRVAEAYGVSLGEVSGTGLLGRITRADVMRAAGVAPEPAPDADRREYVPALVTPEPVQPPSASGSTRRELTRLQALIAQRMAEAKATVPHFQVQTEVVIDDVSALRTQMKNDGGSAAKLPSLNDFIIMASARALRDHPLANGSYKDGMFELHDAVNVGVAVATDEALIVPTVFDAADKSLGQIARDTRALAARVREGSITPAELSGGTFTVSNLGMFGMTAITPVINPPQAAILGVGTLRGQLRREDGEIIERQLLTLTLSCDHRILYGAEAAKFLMGIRELLESPLRLLL